jgi:transposase InsO family protein
MRIEGIRARKALFRKWTTKPDRSRIAAPNRLAQDFEAKQPNKKWVADITYLHTREGWLYLAVVLDLFSRRVVGHATSVLIDTELVLRALRHALGSRRPTPGLVHHSDRGSQYTSDDHIEELRSAGIIVSMSGTGNCYDNAVAESFFATIKTEELYHRRFATRAEATTAIFDYIETFYNSRRLHSTLGYLSPMQFEALHKPRRAA